MNPNMLNGDKAEFTVFKFNHSVNAFEQNVQVGGTKVGISSEIKKS